MTPEQLNLAAAGIEYRATCVANAFTLLAVVRRPPALDQPIVNACIDSSAINARALAEFFGCRYKKYVRATDFVENWVDPIPDVTDAAFHATSRHVGHITKGNRNGEAHPGGWPLYELAAVLLSTLVSLVDQVPSSEVRFDRAHFARPKLNSGLQALRSLDVPPTRLSDNVHVARLTTALQKRMQLPW